MPFINISLTGPVLTQEQKQRLFDETTRLMAQVMNKKAELTSVRIDHYPEDNWAVGGLSMRAREQTGAHMDIKVTKGTNTDKEKAEMIKQAMSMLKDIVSLPPEASYIVIHEVDGTAWGYDGQTQNARAAKATAV